MAAVQPAVADLVHDSFAAGLLVGWRPLAAVLLGGITYVSSSGVIAKVVRWLSNQLARDIRGSAGSPVLLSN